MATTTLTRQQILEHGEALFKAVLRADPPAIHAMHAALVSYVTTGTVGTLQERREAVELVFNFHWTHVLGNVHNGHAMKHYYESNRDVPELEEPPV